MSASSETLGHIAKASKCISASIIWRKLAVMSKYNTEKKVLPASHHADFLSERNSRLPLTFLVLFPINTTKYTFNFKTAKCNQCSGLSPSIQRMTCYGSLPARAAVRYSPSGSPQRVHWDSVERRERGGLARTVTSACTAASHNCTPAAQSPRDLSPELLRPCASASSI